MTETQFIARNEDSWKKLENFNQVLQHKGMSKLSRIEIRAFAETFRSVGYHLAYARTHFPKGTSLPYLMHIVGVAHNYYYVRERRSLTNAKDYVIKGFSAHVRHNKNYILVAMAIFMLGTIFAFAYVSADVSRFNQIFPMEISGENLGEGSAEWDNPLMSAIIMTNNIRVAVLAFALGITAGIGTIWILFYNGMILGSLAAFISVTTTPQNSIIFWSLILPHGVPELIAIFISGACGLAIGKAMLVPNNYTRKDAVILASKRVAPLIPGLVVILIIAALIEGFFTPLDMSPYFKLVFSAISLIGLLLYFRPSEQNSDSTTIT
ncbi:MAG: stage II sporulation protein M [Turicibacter sp.]|nr:stage II sporulation protein M [Turicibacter sp.]